MMKKVSVLMASLLLVAGSAVAQQASFEELDTDADGVLSSSEAEVVEALDFTAADTDQSGDLSQEEYETAVAE